jgi:hypothetical protein
LKKSGKRIEYISKVFNHSAQTYKLVIEILLLGLWNAKSFALDFSTYNKLGKNKNRDLKDKELLQQFSKKYILISLGYLRTLEIRIDKIENPFR